MTFVMMDIDIPDIDAAQIRSFKQDGFVILPGILSQPQIAALQARFPCLFAGKFETGNFPDEWHWREGISLPDVTRHMANAWKSDLTIAALVLSEPIGRLAAQLSGWQGTKLGQDTMWWKPPQCKPISLHQDASYLSFLEPQESITCWVPLDDTTRDAGTLEYIPGSHRWPITDIPDGFLTPDDYRAAMAYAAEQAGITPAEPYFVEVPAGSLVFHTGRIWHGSGPNTRSDKMRRAVGLHMLPDNVCFSEREGGYIYRRYQLGTAPALEESFFPLLWHSDGRRTDWLDNYCRTGRRAA